MSLIQGCHLDRNADRLFFKKKNRFLLNVPTLPRHVFRIPFELNHLDNKNIERLSYKYVKHGDKETFMGFTAPAQTANTFRLEKVYENYELHLEKEPDSIAATCPGNTFRVLDYGYCCDKWVSAEEAGGFRKVTSETDSYASFYSFAPLNPRMASKRKLHSKSCQSRTVFISRNFSRAPRSSH